MCILLMKSITDVHNTALLTVFRSSVMKNKKRINKMREPYKMLVFMLICDNLSLRTLIVVIYSVKKFSVYKHL